jgi:hypothetical protein
MKVLPYSPPLPPGWALLVAPYFLGEDVVCIMGLALCTRGKHPFVLCLRCFSSVVVPRKIFSPKEILEFLEANEKQRPVVIR